MASIIDPKSGRTVADSDPNFDKVRINILQETVRELTVAVGDLQHRLSRVDDEPLHWPGDTYEPTYTKPL